MDPRCFFARIAKPWTRAAGVEVELYKLAVVDGFMDVLGGRVFLRKVFAAAGGLRHSRGCTGARIVFLAARRVRRCMVTLGRGGLPWQLQALQAASLSVSCGSHERMACP